MAMILFGSSTTLLRAQVLKNFLLDSGFIDAASWGNLPESPAPLSAVGLRWIGRRLLGLYDPDGHIAA